MVIFEHHRISFDSVYAAICIYLIVGVVFGILYSITELLIPGSFRFLDEATVNNTIMTRFHLTMFSYSTITTVGNSQVLAIKAFAESLVTLEEIIGVFYLGVLIARLVTGISVIYREKI